jgi:NTP pyrophosphatase (non-canonical NTP hydrolase)
VAQRAVLGPDAPVHRGDRGNRGGRGGATQRRVRHVMAQVGGYWPPLAAVARLLEELGELAELLGHDQPPAPADAPELASELADVWIITAALADQFLGDVPEPGGADAGRVPAPAAEPIAALVVVAGRIARIVNYYDGPKTPRSLDGWRSLAHEVQALHRELAAVAQTRGLDLAAAVDAKLDAIPPRDAGRFARRRDDPATAASLDAFTALSAPALEATLALGPGHARLWGAPAWSDGAPERNIDAIAPALVSFTKAAALERLDAYVIAGPSCTSVERLDEWLAQLLAGLSARDPAPAPAPSSLGAPRTPALQAKPEPPSARAQDTDVAFAFNGVSLSARALSLAHPAGHPRHSPVGTFAVLVVRRPPA